MAPVAVEWLAEASPKLQTTTASAGQRRATPSRAARPMANATPTARGRCEAIVDVCGITASAWLPNTLWRPPALGSSAAATRPSRTSRTRILPAYLAGPLGEEGAGPVVQQGRVGRAAARPRRRRCASWPGGADRVEALALAAQHPGRQVEVPAGQLRSEDLQAAGPSQGAVPPEPAVPGRAAAAAPARRRHRGSPGPPLRQASSRPEFHSRGPRPAAVTMARAGGQAGAGCRRLTGSAG